MIYSGRSPETDELRSREPALFGARLDSFPLGIEGSGSPRRAIENFGVDFFLVMRY